LKETIMSLHENRKLSRRELDSAETPIEAIVAPKVPGKKTGKKKTGKKSTKKKSKSKK